MKKTSPVVHCIFSDSPADPSELLEESFRMYLRTSFSMEEALLQMTQSPDSLRDKTVVTK